VFDTVITGGRVIDPATGRDGKADIAIAKGKIVAIEPSLSPKQCKTAIDAGGTIVLPGLIDTHGHIFEHVSGEFGLNPDAVGVYSGVTAVCDQGGPSALTFGGFRKFIVEPAKTDVTCFLSAYLAGGLYGHRYVDLYGPTGIDVGAVKQCYEENPDIICGLKCHAEPGGYSRWGMKSMKKAKQAARATGLPLYIHLGTLWPEKNGKAVDVSKLVEEIVPLLDEGDILAHPFTRHDGGFVLDGRIHPVLVEAVKRGVKLDVGRGSHFSYANAKAIVDAGIVPDTLGADLHGYNARAESAYNVAGQFRPEEEPDAVDDTVPFSPTFSLVHSMAEMMALGIPQMAVFAMVTSNAAAMLRKSDRMGSLQVGRTADISILKMTSGAYTFADGAGVKFKGAKRLRPVLTLRKGKLYEPVSDLLPEWIRQAA
jgi:dihydroorotase